MPHAPLQALIFDVDGTLADTEAAHREAFNQAFDELGLGWVWDEALYTQLLDISGGHERIHHHWQQVHPGLQALDAQAVHDTVARIHALKTAHYAARVQRGEVVLRPGVLSLIEAAQQHGLRLAIATTTSPANIAALLRQALGPCWRLCFVAVLDASSAALKKPHPLVYRQALQALRLPPQACLAFEDSSNGLRAARGAGLATVVTPTRYTRHHDFGAALRVRPDLAGLTLDTLALWHRQHLHGHAAPDFN